MEEKQQPPKVFISYSHDNSEHKRWVTELASELVKKGIDVILDQWDLSLGDDVPKFMEKSVRKADRVLMICTEPYVHKVDDGKGGVGYEAMIVTGELVRDLGTTKFIPVIRQKSEPYVLPVSVSTRFYIDLSNEEKFKDQFEILLRELHQIPAIEKPSIGRNPFAMLPSGNEMPEVIPNVEPDTAVEGKSADDIYHSALSIARNGDLIAWRHLIRDARQVVMPALFEWRMKYEKEAPKNEEDLVRQSVEAAASYGPLIAIALAGVESGRSKFNNQLSVLDDILFPKGWNLSGFVVVIKVPEAIAYIYQGLHGAMCLLTDQLSLAIKFARTPMEFQEWHESIPLWKNHSVMGWPESLGRNTTGAWKALISLPEKWPWLKQIFGDEYTAAIGAYYMALSINEYADLVASGSVESIISNKDKFFLDIPLCFLSLDDDVARKAYRLLTNEPQQARDIWKSLNVEDSQFVQYWPNWLERCKSWLYQVYSYGHHGWNIYNKFAEDFVPRPK